MQKNAPGHAAPHIPSLDGIRAFSFLIVFLSHAGLAGIVPGHFGLTLFFFLSGFLITTLMRLEFDHTGAVSFKQFYLRRALRILPPFYLVLVAATLLSLSGFLGGQVTARGFLFQAGHLTNYYIIGHGWWNGMAPGTWVYWSLAVEEHFYMVFPLIYVLLRRKNLSGRGQALTLLGICALLLLWRFVLVYGLDAPKDRTYVATDTRIDSILAGCLLAVWRNPVLDAEVWAKREMSYFWLALGVASVAVSLLIRDPGFEQTLRYTLQSFGLLPFFVAAIRFHDRHVFRILNLRPVRYLGLLSYSLYLMHTSVLWALEQKTSLGKFGLTVVALAILIALGTLIYRWIEKPCAALRRRFSRV